MRKKKEEHRVIAVMELVIKNTVLAVWKYLMLFLYPPGKLAAFTGLQVNGVSTSLGILDLTHVSSF